MGCAPAALGHSRQPGSRRGTAAEQDHHAHRAPAHAAAAPERAALRRSRAGSRSGRSMRTCTPRWSSGSPDATGASGGMLHTGRSRNDQVAVDLRLYLKDRVLSLHARATELADVLLAFAAANRTALWPGYTHQRRAMPSSAGLWAAAYAEGLLDTIEAIDGLWPRLDRSPLGSAAGYGVPLPLDRQGDGAGARLPRPRPQRGRGAERARQAGGRRAPLVHRAGPRDGEALGRRDPLQCRRVRLAPAAAPTWPPDRASCRRSGIPTSSS